MRNPAPIRPTENEKNPDSAAGSVALQQAAEAGPGVSPVRVGGRAGDADGLRRVLHRQAREVAQLDQAGGLRILNDEVVLHLALLSGPVQVWLIRRLADRSFILLHPAECDILAHDLVSDVQEWSGTALGRPEMVQVLPSQAGDGTLVRSQIRLPDPDLAGLIGPSAITCSRTWDMMLRSTTPSDH